MKTEKQKNIYGNRVDVLVGRKFKSGSNFSSLVLCIDIDIDLYVVNFVIENMLSAQICFFGQG